MKLIYVVGQPGAGKSSLFEALTSRLFGSQFEKPVKHTYWTDVEGAFVVAEIGWRRPEGFSGTDTLDMAVQPRALQWLSEAPYGLVIGEGDRLANRKFFDALRAVGVDLTVIYLDVSDEVAAERRRERGSQQSESWVKGRITKVRNLAEVADYAITGDEASPRELAWTVVTEIPGAERLVAGLAPVVPRLPG